MSAETKCTTIVTNTKINNMSETGKQKTIFILPFIILMIIITILSSCSVVDKANNNRMVCTERR